MRSEMNAPSVWNGELPKIGIRPTIDGRLGGVRESLEEQTMGLAQRVADMISENVRYPNGDAAQCVVAEPCIGGVAEAAAVDEQFRRENVGVSLTVTPCWCYGSETMDMDPLRPKAVLGLQRHGAAGGGLSGRRPGRSHAKRNARVWHLRTRRARRRRRRDARGRSGEDCSTSLAVDWPRR